MGIALKFNLLHISTISQQHLVKVNTDILMQFPIQ